MSQSPVEIDFLPSTAADDVDLVSALADLINLVYTASEEGLWNDGAARTTPSEVAGLIRLGHIIGAYTNGKLVGSVRVQQLDAATGEFGMLVADPGARGIGVGRELVRFAEHWAQLQGMSVMQLEVLVPRDWTHPSKDFLQKWYTRLGYIHTRTGYLEEAYPHLAPRLATPSDFVIYHKDLRRGSGSPESE